LFGGFVRCEVCVDIDATPEQVWAVLTDVERWPEWTASTTCVQRLDGGAFKIGSTARIKQPRLPAMVWQVIELTPQQSFTWKTKGGGVRTVADHRLTAHASNGVTVTLAIRQLGLLAPLVGLLTLTLTRRYLQLEAQGLKRRCEAG
jgi:uncharacterized protein YndB with AHSA1/START domain